MAFPKPGKDKDKEGKGDKREAGKGDKRKGKRPPPFKKKK